MKRTAKFALVFALAVMLAPMLALAETPAASPTPPAGLTAEDVKTIQDAAQGLSVAFGVQTPTPAPQVSATPAQPKTVAEVADKAVDMVGRLVASAAQTLQKVAPDVWRILIKQQYAKAIGDLTLPVGLFMIALVFNGVYFKSVRKIREGCAAKQGHCGHSSDTHTWYSFCGNVLPVILFSILGIWTFAQLASSIKYLINPEFYAIRDLLTMILNKGQVL